MPKYLIHIHSGPELKNKATLGMLVALTAFKQGNEVKIFLAADGTHLLNIKSEGEVVGLGTGDLKNQVDKAFNSYVDIYYKHMEDNQIKTGSMFDDFINGEQDICISLTN